MEPQASRVIPETPKESQGPLGGKNSHGVLLGSKFRRRKTISLSKLMTQKANLKIGRRSPYRRVYVFPVGHLRVTLGTIGPQNGPNLALKVPEENLKNGAKRHLKVKICQFPVASGNFAPRRTQKANLGTRRTQKSLSLSKLSTKKVKGKKGRRSPYRRVYVCPVGHLRVTLGLLWPSDAWLGILGSLGDTRCPLFSAHGAKGCPKRP